MSDVGLSLSYKGSIDQALVLRGFWVKWSGLSNPRRTFHRSQLESHLVSVRPQRSVPDFVGLLIPALIPCRKVSWYLSRGFFPFSVFGTMCGSSSGRASHAQCLILKPFPGFSNNLLAFFCVKQGEKALFTVDPAGAMSQKYGFQELYHCLGFLRIRQAACDVSVEEVSGRE